jgi:hypothetical protein
MTPRGFSGVVALGPAALGPLLTGGDIFSNVKAGIVYPLAVESEHSWHFLGYPDEAKAESVVHSMRMEPCKHTLCQMQHDCAHIADSFP